jgi:hypothetical protein
MRETGGSFSGAQLHFPGEESKFYHYRSGFMKVRVIFALVLAAAALATVIVLFQPRTPPGPTEARQPQVSVDANTPETQPQPAALEQPAALSLGPAAKTHLSPRDSITATNKLERLAQIRENFRALAAGDQAVALKAAKQIKDDTERETALLTLVTEWTQGELEPPLERARAIELYGLEAGLGMELAKNTQLALTWANELTDGPGREALIRQTAVALTGSDPSAAFALIDQLPDDQRRKFSDEVYAGWAGKDTEAALQWANQLADPAEREAALQAIRSVAPVGIGTALAIKDGYATIAQLLPGTPAYLSGQLHPGDRILALAQGDSPFVDAQGIALSDLVQMIRGAPGTAVQLQVLAADAPPNSLPRTVSIVRDQIKYKR